MLFWTKFFQVLDGKDFNEPELYMSDRQTLSDGIPERFALCYKHGL